MPKPSRKLGRIKAIIIRALGATETEIKLTPEEEARLRAAVMSHANAALVDWAKDFPWRMTFDRVATPIIQEKVAAFMERELSNSNRDAVQVLNSLIARHLKERVEAALKTYSVSVNISCSDDAAE